MFTGSLVWTNVCFTYIWQLSAFDVQESGRTNVFITLTYLEHLFRFISTLSRRVKWFSDGRSHLDASTFSTEWVKLALDETEYFAFRFGERFPPTNTKWTTLQCDRQHYRRLVSVPIRLSLFVCCGKEAVQHNILHQTADSIVHCVRVLGDSGIRWVVVELLSTTILSMYLK